MTSSKKYLARANLDNSPEFIALHQSQYISGSDSEGVTPAASPRSPIRPTFQLLSQQSEGDQNPDFNLDEEEQQKGPVITKLIRITRSFRINWDLGVMILAFWNAISIPFFIAFRPDYEEHVSLFTINTIIDFLFCADIVMNFFTTYIDDAQEEVLDHKMIIRRYLRTTFALDVIASVPVDNFILMFGDVGGEGGTAMQATDMLKLIRILRLSKIIRLMRSKSEIKNTFRLAMLVMYLLLWVHFTGCIWFLVVRGEGDWVPVPDWGSETKFYDYSELTQYNIWFYHSVWFLVGGEVGVRNTDQAAAASILMIAGALLNAVMVGAIADVMSNLNKKSAAFQRMQDGSMSTMHNMELPLELIHKVLDFLTSQYQSIQTKQEFEDFEKFISPTIKRQVNQSIFSRLLQDNKIFQIDEEIREYIYGRIQNLFTKPEEDIVTEGTEPDGFFILAGKGSADVLVTNPNKPNRKQTKVRVLYPGDHFGEVALVFETKRTATVRSVDYCWIAKMSIDHFNAMLNNFHKDGLLQAIRESTENYKDPWKKFIYSMLSQVNYLVDFIPKKKLLEMVYMMDIQTYDEGTWVVRPGDVADQILFVTEGEIEISMVVNDAQLAGYQIKTQTSFAPNMSQQLQAIERKQTFSADKKFHLAIRKMENLKRKPEMIPVIEVNEITGAFEGDPSEEVESVGNYLQEIIVAQCSRGSIIHKMIALVEAPLQINIKVTQPGTTIYALPMAQILAVAKDNDALQSYINKQKSLMMPYDSLRRETVYMGPLVDYYSVNQSRARQRWRMAIYRVIGLKRQVRKKINLDFTEMIERIKSIQAWEAVGNYDLASKVAKGQISHYWISEQGFLLGDPAKNCLQNAALPDKHPLMRYYKTLYKDVNTGKHRTDKDENFKMEDSKKFQSTVQTAKNKVESIMQLLTKNDMPARTMASRGSPVQQHQREAYQEPSVGISMQQHEQEEQAEPSVATSLRQRELEGYIDPPVDTPLQKHKSDRPEDRPASTSMKKYGSGCQPEGSFLQVESPEGSFDPTRTPYFAAETPVDMDQPTSNVFNSETELNPPGVQRPDVNKDLLKIDIDEVARIRQQQAQEKEERAKKRKQARKHFEEEKNKEDSAPQQPET